MNQHYHRPIYHRLTCRRPIPAALAALLLTLGCFTALSASAQSQSAGAGATMVTPAVPAAQAVPGPAAQPDSGPAQSRAKHQAKKSKSKKAKKAKKAHKSG